MVVPSLTGVGASSTIDNGASVADDRRRLAVSGVSLGDSARVKCEEINGNCSESPGLQRRSSARIQKLKSEKALRLRGREDSSNHTEEKVVRKKNRACEKRKTNPPDVRPPVADGNKRNDVSEVVTGSNERKDSSETNMGLTEVTPNGTGGEKSAYALVTETLRTFNKHYLHFVQEEEKRCEKVEADRKATKGLNSKKGNPPEDDTKRSSKRPDLKAITMMMTTNTILYPNKRFGPIPGIDVGHQFFSRAEMVAVGFHSHWLNGIDYIGQNASKVMCH